MKTYRRLLLIVALVAAAALQPASESASVAQSARSLHERAQRAGGRLVELYEPDRRVVYHDLSRLAAASDAIVIGQLLSHRPQLSPDGQRVTKDARVRVQGVVKGGMRPGATIQMRLAGGGYVFPDGTFAYVGPKNVRQAQERKPYVFFLKMTGASYELVSETQALFALANGKVEPSDAVGSATLVARHKGQDAASFLAEVRKAADGRKN